MRYDAICFLIGVWLGWSASQHVPLKYRPFLRRRIRLAPELKRKLRRQE